MDGITTTPKLNAEQIFDQLKQFITEVIGEEFVEDMDITMESSFTKELEMDSIEIVAFSEKVKTFFGSHIDFTGWMSGMDLDQLINLSLGDIVNYISQCQ